MLGNAILIFLAAASYMLCVVPAHGQDGVPDPKEWAEEVLRGKDSAAGRFPRKVVFLSQMPTVARRDIAPAMIDRDGFNDISFIKAKEPLDIEWNFKLNRARLAELEPTEAVFAIADADTAAVVSTAEGSRLISPPSDVDVTLGNYGEDLEPTNLVDWLINTLGWDGVVLDQRGSYVLVASFAPVLAQPNIQALSMRESAERFLIRKENKNAMGLLAVKRVAGYYGVFKIVYLKEGKKNLETGTKLIIERKKS